MNVEQVIQQGKDMMVMDGNPDLWVGIGFLAIFAGVILGLLGFIGAYETSEADGFAFLMALVLFVGGILLIVFNIGDASAFEKKQLKKWEAEIAKPYIDSLPVVKQDVVFIKVDTALSHKVTGSNYYTTSQEVQRTPLTISFKENNGLITLTNWYQTRMELTDKEEPYVEYQYVPQNLGHGFKKGHYNVKIFLPEDYKFTEIK